MDWINTDQVATFSTHFQKIQIKSIKISLKSHDLIKQNMGILVIMKMKMKNRKIT